jgi:hypothetical protein
MISRPALEETRPAGAPFLTQESSAQHRPLKKQRLSEADMEYLSHRFAANHRPAEEFIEVRQNGTNGHANILPFNHTANGEARRAAPLSEAAEPPVMIEKPQRPAPKPRVRAAAKKAPTPDTLSGTGTKPPRVGVNIEWVQKGVGWDCREVYYVGKQRRRRHLGHIGRQKWEEMQQQYSGAALEEVLREWIEARRAEKSMSLSGE